VNVILRRTTMRALDAKATAAFSQGGLSVDPEQACCRVRGHAASPDGYRIRNIEGIPDTADGGVQP